MVPSTVLLLVVCEMLVVIGWINAFSVDGGHFKTVRSSKRCSYTKKYHMLMADCYGLDLTSVPPNLRSDIEILDATMNRIRELYKNTFEHYTYLKILYLEENMIKYIEEGTFDNLLYLEVVDLSSNSLDKIPSGVLQLPKLRKLYMNNNRLNADTLGFVDAPHSEVMEFIAIANAHLQKMPILDKFPNLLHLNVSGNELKSILPQDIAPTCQLQILDLGRNPALFKDTTETDGCDCLILDAWITNKGISLPQGSSLNCTSTEHGTRKFHSCGNITEPEEARETYNACMSAVISRAEAIQSRTTWLIIVIVLASVLGTVILILLYLHKRNKRKQKKRKKASAINSGSASGNRHNNNNGKEFPEREEEEIPTNQLLETKQS